MRNIKTREGFEFWDKICALKHFGFIHSPDNSRVLKAEGIGNWIDKHDAQEVVDQAQDRINELVGKLNKALAREVQLRTDKLDDDSTFNAAYEKLKRVEAALREELERATSRYDREVLGLNNERDPIGGDPAGGYKNENAALQQRLTFAERRANDAIELLEVWRTWLGASRSSCDESGKLIWDRIDSVVALNTAEECPHCETGKITQNPDGAWNCNKCEFMAPENDGGLDDQ